MSDLYQSLSHSRPDSKSNITQCESPKRRRKAVFGKLRRRLGKASYALARQREGQILEGYLLFAHSANLPVSNRSFLLCCDMNFPYCCDKSRPLLLAAA